ncbi:MAG: SEC-C metal-binding domain-containing protein, partial [Spirochaetales bacterium]|nr:SEC-C metal-binding domain-containing protein [Spirochaetales bacterium]
AVYLRSYAQKNPLLEYKLEGSDIFESLITNIRSAIASKVFRVRIRREEAPAATHQQPAKPMQADHSSISSFDEESSSVRHESAIAAASRPEAATVVRSGQKIGRNDPCPCGSGKKYKHCHGR